MGFLDRLAGAFSGSGDDATDAASDPACDGCGSTFSVDDARSEFDSDDEWAGELTYDDSYPEHSLCGSCAVALTVENLGAGRGMMFSLETGLPPEDVPDDWSPEDD